MKKGNYIFLDTSIFIKENFLEGKRINQLFALAQQKKISLLVPLITVNEVKHRYKSSVEAGREQYNRAIKSVEVRALRNHKLFKDKVQKIANLEEISQSFNDEFDATLNAAIVNILPYPNMDTKEIFEPYFKREKPFNDNATKKHEFPDAFALATLRNWCKANGKNCIIFSKDNDMIDLDDPYLISGGDYEVYLSDLLKELELEKARLNILEYLIKANESKLVSETKYWLKGQLGDVSLYYDVSNMLDVYDIHIISVEASFGAYEIVNTTERFIEIEVNISSDIDVKILIDDEESIYKDYDDKSWHYADTVQVEIRRTLEVPITVSFSISNEEDYEPDGEIVKFNNDKEIEIELRDGY